MSQYVHYRNYSLPESLMCFQRSCYVYGIVDELGVLNDGEVYINLPYREGPIVSDVLVAR